MMLCGQCKKTFLFGNGWCPRCRRFTRVDREATPVSVAEEVVVEDVYQDESIEDDG